LADNITMWKAWGGICQEPRRGWGLFEIEVPTVLPMLGLKPEGRRLQRQGLRVVAAVFHRGGLGKKPPSLFKDDQDISPWFSFVF
jgi:hypothetical protein